MLYVSRNDTLEIHWSNIRNSRSAVQQGQIMHTAFIGELNTMHLYAYTWYICIHSSSTLTIWPLPRYFWHYWICIQNQCMFALKLHVYVWADNVRCVYYLLQRKGSICDWWRDRNMLHYYRGTYEVRMWITQITASVNISIIYKLSDMSEGYIGYSHFFSPKTRPFPELLIW